MTRTATARREPTQPMLNFMYRLAGERVVPQWGTCGEERIESLGARVEDTHPDFHEVGRMIDWLKTQPHDRADAPADDFDAQTLKPGAYRRDGVIYIVKPNREKTRVYAKRMVVINGERLTEAGTVVKIEFEYERGAIFQLRPEHRLSTEECEALSIRYEKCIMCGRGLKAAKSVQRMIGPVCYGYIK
jgi:Family of unknown function (DUF6011)